MLSCFSLPFSAFKLFSAKLQSSKPTPGGVLPPTENISPEQPGTAHLQSAFTNVIITFFT